MPPNTCLRSNCGTLNVFRFPGNVVLVGEPAMELVIVEVAALDKDVFDLLVLV